MSDETPRLMVRVMGPLTVEHADGEVPLPASRRARGLLAWLAVHPGGRSRSQAAAAFWPDVPEVSARSSLRGALAELRRSLGPYADVLVADRERITLDRRGAVVDLDEFRAHLGAGRWAEALLLDRGRLLADVDDEWSHRRRDEHTQDVLRALRARAAELEAEGLVAEAVSVAQRRVRIDPLSEDAGRELVRLLALDGDRAAAVEAGRALVDRLQRELGVPPSAATLGLLDALRRDDPAVPSAAPPSATAPTAAAAGATAPVVAGPSAPDLRDLLPAELVEREAPLARIREVRSGPRPVAVLVRGEAGIGKTSLAATAAVEAARDGATVLFGRCDEEAIVPFCPWVEALGPFVEALDAAAARRVVADGGAELARLFPTLPAPAGTERAPEADSERWRLFEAITRLLVGLAADRPLMLVLEDLHWADPSSTALLRHVLRTTQDADLVVVATTRDDAGPDDPVQEVTRQLALGGLLVTVDLEGLSPDGVARLAGDQADREDWPRFVTALHQETEGNPFFVNEILRTVAGSRHQVAADRPFAVPDNVRVLLRRRLARLGAPVEEVLGWASVVGRCFGLDLVTRCSGLPEDAVLDALDVAVDARLVDEQAVGTYCFSHALVRSTLYDGHSRTRRARMHARVARALEQAPEASAGELAHHYLATADLAFLDVGVGYAREAAARAISQLGYEEAASFTQRAIDAVRTLQRGDHEQLGPLLLELGDARSRSGDTVGARDAFLQAADAARTTGHVSWLGSAALGFAGPSWQGFGTVDDDAIALLEEALAALCPDAVLLRARLQARLAVALYFAHQPGRLTELTDAALATGRELGDVPVLAAALEARLWASWHPDGIADRIATAEELLALAEDAGAGETAAAARRWRLVALLEAGRLDEVWAEAARHADDARRLGLPYEQMYVSVFATMRALLDGRLDEARTHAAHVATFAEVRGGADALQFGGVHAMSFAVADGDAGSLVGPLGDFVEAYPAIPGWRAARAFALAAAGRRDEAAAEVGTLWPPEESIPYDAVWLAAHCFLAAAVVAVGDRDRAAHLRRLLAPYAGRPVVLGAGGAVLGDVDLYLGLLDACVADDAPLVVEVGSES